MEVDACILVGFHVGRRSEIVAMNGIFVILGDSQARSFLVKYPEVKKRLLPVKEIGNESEK